MTDNDILKLGHHIKKAAKSVAYQWPGVLEADDAEQAISLKLLESPGSIKKITGMEPDAQYRAIVGIGHQLASAARADYDYYKGSYRYSVAETKDVLSKGVLTEDVEGFDEAVFDMIEAFVVLTKKSPQYVDSLLDRYANWEIPSQGADAVRLSRALTALTWQMNLSNKRRFSERDDGPGSREVLTNQKAHYLSQYDETGDYGLVHDENREQRQS